VRARISAMPSSRRFVLLVVVLVVVLVVAGSLACSGKDSTASDDSQITGTYTLRLVNGQAPPVLLSPAEFPYQVVSGTLTLHSEGSVYTDRIVTHSQGADHTRTRTGTWQQLSGGRIEFRRADVLPVVYDTATLVASTITRGFDDGAVLTYRK
jgi:hypothetical protein